MERKVAVTGIGVISSLGTDKDAFWKNLTQGKSGISKVDLFDTANFRRHYGGQLKNFDLSLFIRRSFRERGNLYLNTTPFFQIICVISAICETTLFYSFCGNKCIPFRRIQPTSSFQNTTVRQFIVLYHQPQSISLHPEGRSKNNENNHNPSTISTTQPFQQRQPNISKFEAFSLFRGDLDLSGEGQIHIGIRITRGIGFNFKQ